MDWELISDSALARHCRAGSRDAWRQLIRRCAPTAYRVAIQVTRDPTEAEDACQEVFVRVYRYFDTYDPKRPLRPWVARIAYHVCLRAPGGRTRQATACVSPNTLDRLRDERTADPERAAARTEAHHYLARAIDAIDTEDRALLALRYLEGLSDREIARVAEMPVNTVKTRIFRARARLRRALKPVLAGGT